MHGSLQEFKSKALASNEVREAYDELEDEFELLDVLLKARTMAGMTQAQIAERIGTTQSAIARLESPASKHSPSLQTLQKYAKALGYKLQIRFIKESSHG